MEKNYHLFHMVTLSPWPLIIGLVIFSVVIGGVKVIMFTEMELFFLSLITLMMIMMLWWRDVIRESTFQGSHTSIVLSGLMVGMLLFIISEIFFFLSFFWAFFHSSLSPTFQLGAMWPPIGVCPFNVFQVPLLNTVILLSSGISITWSHQSILNGDWYVASMSLMLTWMLGLYFLSLQGLEYFTASFSISDSVYGSSFFMATGFHGFHVIVGTVYLFMMWLRMKSSHFSYKHHFGFEAAAWYWHFVDVVWLFLFLVVYWWGT